MAITTMESVFIKEECLSDDEPATVKVEVIIDERIGEKANEEEKYGNDAIESIFIDKMETLPISTEKIMDNDIGGIIENGLYPCPDCDASFTSLFYLEAHQKMCKSRLHLREMRDTSFTTTENFHTSKVELEETNEGELYEKRDKQYACKKCAYVTKKCSSIKGHLRTHTGDRPFSCPLCSYAAAESGQVKRHMRIHSGERPYSCPECDYSAAVITNLKNHLLTHSRARPYSCHECSFTCTQATSLKEHIRTHTGEKPFRCSFCEYCCSRSNTLKRHLMTHTGRKPFQCTVCEYRCSESGALKVHMRTHTGERPFACTLCAYRSVQSGELRRHVRTKHKRDPDEVLHSDPAPLIPSS